MVAMSGSTRGWANEAEREALVLLAESQETLGDRYAIYGFSGWTRKRCEAYRIKTFDEALDEAVKARICGIEPKDYTRTGAPMRHLTRLFRDVEARIKLLVTLSDGKPDDSITSIGAITASRIPARPCSKRGSKASTRFSSPSTDRARSICPTCMAPPITWSSTRWRSCPSRYPTSTAR